MESVTAEAAHDSARDEAVGSVLGAMMTIGRAMRRRRDDDVLDPGSVWLLKSVRQAGPSRIRDLADVLGLDASTVSRHVASLQSRGLIDRTGDPDDGRAQLIMVTDDGAEVLHSSMQRRRELLTTALDAWPDEDLLALDRLLHRFVDDVEASVLAEENS